jgi:hypothetical protein
MAIVYRVIYDPAILGYVGIAAAILGSSVGWQGDTVLHLYLGLARGKRPDRHTNVFGSYLSAAEPFHRRDYFLVRDSF